jgi:hypothetical protein
MAKASGSHGMVTLNIPWCVGINFTRFLSASGYFSSAASSVPVHSYDFMYVSHPCLTSLPMSGRFKNNFLHIIQELVLILVNLMLGGTDDAESLIVSALSCIVESLMMYPPCRFVIFV